MSLTTVAELRSTLGVGTLYPDATLQEVCDASDAVLLPMLWTNTDFAIGHSNVGTVGTLYFDHNVEKTYYVGQSVVITGAGSHFNGNKTITGVSNRTFTVTTNHVTNTPYHPFNPYANIAADTYVDWADDKAVQQAALLISVDIWQSRMVSSTGGVSPDFTPSPYRLGNTLLARIRALIAHALSPNSMVG